MVLYTSCGDSLSHQWLPKLVNQQVSGVWISSSERKPNNIVIRHLNEIKKPYCKINVGSILAIPAGFFLGVFVTLFNWLICLHLANRVHESFALLFCGSKGWKLFGTSKLVCVSLRSFFFVFSCPNNTRTRVVGTGFELAKVASVNRAFPWLAQQVVKVNTCFSNEMMLYKDCADAVTLVTFSILINLSNNELNSLKSETLFHWVIFGNEWLWLTATKNPIFSFLDM